MIEGITHIRISGGEAGEALDNARRAVDHDRRGANRDGDIGA